MRAERILETCLYVDDLDAAEAFYTRVLGLARLGRDPERHVFFRCGEGVLLLFNPALTVAAGTAPPHGAHGPGHLTFAMAASEAPAWRAWLREQGVEIEREVGWPGGGLSLYFRDPAGNSLELATPTLWFPEA